MKTKSTTTGRRKGEAKKGREAQFQETKIRQEALGLSDRDIQIRLAAIKREEAIKKVDARKKRNQQ